jgi:hypothetical protein
MAERLQAMRADLLDIARKRSEAREVDVDDVAREMLAMLIERYGLDPHAAAAFAQRYWEELREAGRIWGLGE